QRERAVQSAQAEVEVAQRGVEQAREVMQLVLDNISDGVVLADNNLDLKFANRRFVEFLQLPPEIVSSGRGYDVLRFQAKRGDFGQVARAATSAARNDVERAYQMTQSILDNLSDGVVLADKHFYLKFANRHFAEFLQIPAEIARPGRSAYDVLRFLARRDD